MKRLFVIFPVVASIFGYCVGSGIGYWCGKRAADRWWNEHLRYGDIWYDEKGRPKEVVQTSPAAQQLDDLSQRLETVESTLEDADGPVVHYGRIPPLKPWPPLLVRLDKLEQRIKRLESYPHITLGPKGEVERPW